jgi:hypothetical protein
MPLSAVREGSTPSSTAGGAPWNSRSDATPKPLGTAMKALRVPLRTDSSASARVVRAVSSSLAPSSRARNAAAPGVWSSSTSATLIVD